MQKECIFLTLDQAVDAVRIDLKQYTPQLMMVSGLIELVSDGRIAVRREPEKMGIWLGEPGRQKMRWLEWEELVIYLCTSIITPDMGPEKLAAVCGRVFRTRAVPDKDLETGVKGIRIETGMEDFSCRQCGACCRNLDYHHQLTEADVRQWRRLGRRDILAWVDIQKHDGCETGYRIWVKPGTHHYAETCPFLKKNPMENRWICTIHDVKPEICRNYPVSRKHAAMTGCPGFERQHALPAGDRRIASGGKKRGKKRRRRR